MVVMGAQPCGYTENHWTAHFWRVSFMVYELYQFRKQRSNNDNKKIHLGTSRRADTLVIKNLPVHCSTESTEWALSIPPAERRWHRKQGWLFSGHRISLSLFMLSLSSRPALSLWKPLPVLHTAVQPLHKSNRGDNSHGEARSSQGGIFSWTNGRLHSSVRRTLLTLRRFMTSLFSSS